MNLAELFRSEFRTNVTLPAFLPGLAKSPDPVISRQFEKELAFADFFVAPDNYFTEKSEQGYPMWDVFRFAPGNQRRDYTANFSEDYSGWAKLSDYTVVSLSRPKNIVLTPLPGADHQVPELINMSNWELRFFGFIVDSTVDQYPLAKVQELNQLYSPNTSAQVASKLLNGLGIYDVVFTNLDISPSDGYSNMAKFELTAISVQPIELIIQEEVSYE